MEWEWMGRDEKLERVRKKKESWEVSRMSKAIAVELVEEAISWTEEKPMREILEEIVLEGWRNMETARVLRMISDSEQEIQSRVVRYCLEKKAEEESLLLTLRLEEERQRRLERTEVLKLLLTRKLGAKKLKNSSEVEMNDDALSKVPRRDTA